MLEHEPEYYLTHLDEAKELITDLANDLVDYNIEYEIVENPYLHCYDETCEPYFRFPYIAKFSLYWPIYYVQFEVELQINEDFDGLEYWPEDYPISVNNPEWFFLIYSDRLQDKIRQLQRDLEYKEQEIKKITEQKNLEIDALKNQINFMKNDWRLKHGIH